MSFRGQKRQLAFSESYQQLENSANSIPFSKIFCGLNFQLKDGASSYRCIFTKVMTMGRK